MNNIFYIILSFAYFFVSNNVYITFDDIYNSTEVYFFL